MMETNGGRSTHFHRRLVALVDQGLPDGSRATATEIARRANDLGWTISRSYISSLIKGKARNPTLASAEAIAAVFDIDPAYFFGSATESPGVAYSVVASAANDPRAAYGGLGDEIDDEKVKLVAEFAQYLQRKRGTGTD